MVPFGNKAKRLSAVNHTAKKSSSSSSSSKRESFMTSELIILFMSVFLKIKVFTTWPKHGTLGHENFFYSNISEQILAKVIAFQPKQKGSFKAMPVSFSEVIHWITLTPHNSCRVKVIYYDIKHSPKVVGDARSKGSVPGKWQVALHQFQSVI